VIAPRTEANTPILKMRLRIKNARVVQAEKAPMDMQANTTR
jgi:hypothetical protein